MQGDVRNKADSRCPAVFVPVVYSENRKSNFVLKQLTQECPEFQDLGREPLPFLT